MKASGSLGSLKSGLSQRPLGIRLHLNLLNVPIERHAATNGSATDTLAILRAPESIMSGQGSSLKVLIGNAILGPAIPAHSLAVSSLDGDSLIYERFAHPFGPDTGQIVSKTDTLWR